MSKLKYAIKIVIIVGGTFLLIQYIFLHAFTNKKNPRLNLKTKDVTYKDSIYIISEKIDSVFSLYSEEDTVRNK